MIPSFPKIFALGSVYIQNIYDGPVEITEKIDGSQFVFGVVNGELFIRSKRKQLFPEYPEKMFIQAIDYVSGLYESGKLPNNLVFFCEYLKAEKHNLLKYSRIPKNHFMLFGVATPDESFSNYESILEWSSEFNIEPVPIIEMCEGKELRDIEFIKTLIDQKSVLGGCQIEGIVVKNYNQTVMVGDRPLPITAAKFVSEQFKEVKGSGVWKKENTTSGKWEQFIESYRTEARWNKAVQHLKESGELDSEPKDIGKLIKEVNKDIIDEEEDVIKDFLFKTFGKDLIRRSTAGLPEWYKEKLVAGL